MRFFIQKRLLYLTNTEFINMPSDLQMEIFTKYKANQAGKAVFKVSAHYTSQEWALLELPWKLT
jgi:hypothetical protein